MPEIIRDPLWNNISLDSFAIELVDLAVFQRLRYVRQLGLAYLVYPGATHTRFEHALGTYHLARRTLSILAGRSDVSTVSREDAELVSTAALLHDIGHYPFSHALEELGAPHHETIASSLLGQDDLACRLRERLGSDAPDKISQLIRGVSDAPLQGLISGSLDLDKIEYLKRDAFMCGVPYGEIDVDRLLHSLVIIDDPDHGRPVVGVSEKALSALESLLFAKYQMYRNVYWHHAVRSATAMYKRLVEDALANGDVLLSDLPGLTDEGLLHRLDAAPAPDLLTRLRQRRLFKRVFECPSAGLDQDAGEWIASDRELTRNAEDQLAKELGRSPGDILLDFPTKTQMLDLNLPVLQRDGSVRRLTSEGLSGVINLPRLSDELYRSARWLRVFGVESARLEPRQVLGLVHLPATEVRRRIESGVALLDS